MFAFSPIHNCDGESGFVKQILVFSTQKRIEAFYLNSDNNTTKKSNNCIVGSVPAKQIEFDPIYKLRVTQGSDDLWTAIICCGVDNEVLFKADAVFVSPEYALVRLVIELRALTNESLEQTKNDILAKAKEIY